MSSKSIRRQDASGLSGAPTAVCHNGRVIDLMPAGMDDSDQPTREALFAAASAETGIPVMELEILLVCHLHPTSSAVDCLDCEPIEN
jgi:hypothetical protein